MYDFETTANTTVTTLCSSCEGSHLILTTQMICFVLSNINNVYEYWYKIVKLLFPFQECLVLSSSVPPALRHMEVLVYDFVLFLVGSHRSSLFTYVNSAPGHHLKAMEAWHRDCSASGCQLWHKPTLLNGSGCVICT